MAEPWTNDSINHCPTPSSGSSNKEVSCRVRFRHTWMHPPCCCWRSVAKQATLSRKTHAVSYLDFRFFLDFVSPPYLYTKSKNAFLAAPAERNPSHIINMVYFGPLSVFRRNTRAGSPFGRLPNVGKSHAAIAGEIVECWFWCKNKHTVLYCFEAAAAAAAVSVLHQF